MTRWLLPPVRHCANGELPVLGWRSLKHPPRPDRALPDWDGQCERFWAQSSVWWDNWAHNFLRSIIVFPALAAVIMILIITLD